MRDRQLFPKGPHLSSVVPVSTSKRAGSMMLLPDLVWLNMKRLTRGWRWRAFLLIAGVGSYWFARLKGFGAGSTVWFPGGPRGIEGFTLFMGVAAVILGGDCVGQWDRY
ncbi:MAG: hypothetical protein ABI579_09350, partial [Candidatus Sumerlaeota bacterium]